MKRFSTLYISSLLASLLLFAPSISAHELYTYTTAFQNEEAEAQPDAVDFVPMDDGYQGGRGLITLQGMSGMFLNPTSGTLGQGQLTVQYCVGLYNNAGPNDTVHGLMAAYGVFDWLEVGGVWQYYDVNSRSSTFELAAPFVRVRVLKDEDWLPETSFGFMYLDGDSGDDVLQRMEFFVAMSKRFVIDEQGFVRAVRPHLGARHIERNEYPRGIVPTINTIPGYDPNGNAFVGFGGLEFELPYDISFVAEVSTKDDFADHIPWAAGFQWKPNEVLGLSLGLAEGPGEDNVTIYIGIGLNFEF